VSTKRPFLVNLWRWAIMLTVSLYLLTPLAAMLDFSTKIGRGHRGLYAWKAIFQQPDLIASIFTSLELALIVVVGVFVLVVPTVVWVHLKLPRLRRPLELICLLPLAFPAIVLVVGVARTYLWISIHISESPLTLAAVYLVLILPYSYRSIAAALNSVDVHTLAEAARTLGASTARVLFGIVMPTIRAGVMSAAVISIALVLGEYTIASLLNFQTMQVSINLIGQQDASIAVAVSLASLIFVFVLLAILPTSSGRRTKVLESTES
jgi:putative spermidine/putrescine transport system permease protein